MVQGGVERRRRQPGPTTGIARCTSKHQLPRARSTVVIRRTLLDRLLVPRPGSVISIVAPAGYGKTTLLQQWADREGEVAYVRLDARDDDPAVLLSDLVVSLERAGAVEPALLDRLGGRGSDLGLPTFQRLTDALWDVERPVILMLDDLHTVTGRGSLDGLSWLADRLPESLRLVVAGRTAPALPMARLAASGRWTSVTASDLAFDVDQTIEMAGAMGAALPTAAADELVARTQGWPIAIYLSLLPRRPGGSTEPPIVSAASPSLVDDYLRRELLEPLADGDQDWLLRSAVLDVLSGPLCDAALETMGSQARLHVLERANLLIERLEDGASYRHHPLLHALLREELDSRLPGEATAVARRAAAWCDEHGELERAVEFAHESGDLDLLASLVARAFWGVHWAGRTMTMERWFRWFDHDGVRERYPTVAVFAGFMYALDGRRVEAEGWLAAAERSSGEGPMPDGSPTKAPWVAALRGLLMPRGVAQLSTDVRMGLDGLAHDSPVVPTILLEAAVERLLVGALSEAAEYADEAAAVAGRRGAMPGLTLALGLQACIALRSGDGQAAQRITRAAIVRSREIGLDDSLLGALLHAVGARALLMSGAVAEAIDLIGVVTRVRPRLTAATPWLSVAVLLEAAKACLALSDAASARAMLADADDILRVRPDLGILGEDATEVRGALAAASDPGTGIWALTNAELRVLTFLPTHLTFAEIAERLVVSPFTIKSQAVAIYGKLGVASRRAAIERAVETGLLERSALRYPSGSTEAGVG